MKEKILLFGTMLIMMIGCTNEEYESILNKEEHIAELMAKCKECSQRYNVAVSLNRAELEKIAETITVDDIEENIKNLSEISFVAKNVDEDQQKKKLKIKRHFRTWETCPLRTEIVKSLDIYYRLNGNSNNGRKIGSIDIHIRVYENDAVESYYVCSISDSDIGCHYYVERNANFYMSQKSLGGSDPNTYRGYILLEIPRFYSLSLSITCNEYSSYSTMYVSSDYTGSSIIID